MTRPEIPHFVRLVFRSQCVSEALHSDTFYYKYLKSEGMEGGERG